MAEPAVTPLHPVNRWEWMQVVEGNPPTAVCDHCGEAVPCVDAVLLHNQTQEHHDMCQAVGHCYYARRDLD